MQKDYINYGELIDRAMHDIVREALKVAQNRALLGEHHFFISFITGFPGVIVSEKLHRRYPREMTIVLQYQYEDLRVTEDAFSVVLSFDNVKERITIPFEALTAFADPSVKFGLQFRHLEIEDEEEEEDEEEVSAKPRKEPQPLPSKKPVGVPASNQADKKEAMEASAAAKKEKADNIISLDRFRNKKKPEDK